jgi:hypothetical protein
MREAYAQDAVLLMNPDADVRAPGAAITVALCGHWDHEPPCPLSPHQVNVDRVGEEVRLRVVFVVEPDREPTVRSRIDEALEHGRLDVDGTVTQWRLRESRPGDVRPEERELASRLMTS